MDVRARRTRTALQLLKQDHHIAAALFDRYQHAADHVDCLKIAQLISQLVTIHARCEDALRYEVPPLAASPRSRTIADRQIIAMIDRINDPDIPQWTYFVDSMQVPAANAEPHAPMLNSPARFSEPHKETDDVR